MTLETQNTLHGQGRASENLFSVIIILPILECSNLRISSNSAIHQINLSPNLFGVLDLEMSEHSLNLKEHLTKKSEVSVEGKGRCCFQSHTSLLLPVILYHQLPFAYSRLEPPTQPIPHGDSLMGFTAHPAKFG